MPAVAVLPDGRIAWALHDRTPRLWDPGGGRELPSLVGHEGPVLALAVLPD